MKSSIRAHSRVVLAYGGLFAFLLVFVGACQGAPATPLFEVPGAAAAVVGEEQDGGFYALPFPNNLRADDDGVIDLSDHPAENAIVSSYLQYIQERQRFFTINGASFFRFDGELDTGSLPNPAASVEEGAAVYLVNIDRQSARYGRKVPLRSRFQSMAGESIGANWLSVLPYPGMALDDETTYAVVVTNRLRAKDGGDILPAPGFVAIAADDTASDPALAAAQQEYLPLWDWLDEPGGDEREDVVVASVFTTQRARDVLSRVREVVYATDPPVVRDFVEHSPENSLWAAYTGVYDAPNFQAGQVPYINPQSGGDIQFDDGGQPVVQRMEEMRVAFTIPSGTMPAGGWPVVIYAHGTGGSYLSFLNFAGSLAREGLAVVGIDQNLHGERNPGGSPDFDFFNFANPLSARDNNLQAAIDNFQLLRLLKGFEEQLDGSQQGVARFDPDKIFFMGHSQGGLTGTPFLAYEPDVKGAVLSGAGGALYLTLVNKTLPIDIVGLVELILQDDVIDEFHPALALLQGWLDRSDPVTFGRHLVHEPFDGIGAKHIFQTEGFVDLYTPIPNIEALATAIGGDLVAPIVQPVEGLTLQQRDVLTPPVFENTANGVTAVLSQYESAPGSDGHFVVFDIPDARQRASGFLGTLARNGVAIVTD